MNLGAQGGLKIGKTVTVETQSEVADITEINDDHEEHRVAVTLTNGKVIHCDFVVSATGVIPNGELIKIDHLELDGNRAIVVNDRMESNLKHIYAAGDVCSCASWSHSPLWFQMRLWTQARQMGHYAGQCLHSAWLDDGSHRGLDFCFEIFSHVTHFFGLKVILLGLFNGQGLQPHEYEVLLRVTKGQEYVKVILKAVSYTHLTLPTIYSV